MAIVKSSYVRQILQRVPEAIHEKPRLDSLLKLVHPDKIEYSTNKVKYKFCYMGWWHQTQNARAGSSIEGVELQCHGAERSSQKPSGPVWTTESHPIWPIAKTNADSKH